MFINQPIENRRVAETEIDGEHCWVSTVFLGLDYNYNRTGEPVLFETMAFGGPLDEETDRYCTWAEAERGHEEMVTKCRKAIAQVNAIAKAANEFSGVAQKVEQHAVNVDVAGSNPAPGAKSQE